MKIKNTKNNRLIILSIFMLVVFGIMLKTILLHNNYWEDTTLTKKFNDDNKEKLSKIYIIKNDGNSDTYYSTGMFYAKKSLNKKCSDHNILIMKKFLNFDESEVKENTVDFLYNEATKCLNLVLEQEEKILQEKKEKERIYKENELKKVRF